MIHKARNMMHLLRSPLMNPSPASWADTKELAANPASYQGPPEIIGKS